MGSGALGYAYMPWRSPTLGLIEIHFISIRIVAGVFWQGKYDKYLYLMNQNTLEQYAFAIGFDFELDSKPLGEPSESATTAITEAVGVAIQTAGLPALDSDRWDEFGQGRLFWGTKSECDAVKQVLSQFPLFLQEERNLDPGYYANASDTYYVDEVGHLYRVLKPLSSSKGDALESINTIPLDAYRLKSIDPNLQEAVERSLSNLSQPDPSPLPDPPALSPTNRLAAAEQGAAEQAAQVLRAQLAQQTAQIGELERQVTVFEDQISFLQGVAATKIDPQRMDSLQTQFAQQTLHLQQVEARLAQAEGHVKSWESKAEQWIDPQVHTQIQQQLSAKIAQIQELEQRIQRHEQQLQDAVEIAAQKVDAAKYQSLEQTLADKTVQVEKLKRDIVQIQRDLGEWQTVAESKVEWSEYQALQQELQKLQAKQKKGFFSRLFSRLFG
jgi:hypothetical protein